MLASYLFELTIWSLMLWGSVGFALEHTKVLPKGVRNVDIKVVNSEISEQTNNKGVPEPLAKPITQDLTFEKAAKEEKDAIKRIKLKGFLRERGLSDDDSLGQYTGDVQGQVTVVAPIISYGITESLTLAIAVPIYRASTAVSVGFQPSGTGQRFLELLAEPYSNEIQEAHVVGRKLNNAVDVLNEKLVNDGYEPIQNWSGSGIGDMTLAAKYRFFEAKRIASATTFGVTAPSGKKDDPDSLTDVGFGDGSWDTFAQISFDQPLGSWQFFMNEFTKYTVQFADQKEVRMITEDDPIADSKRTVRYKLGDKFDAGWSLQYEPSFGLVTGTGYSYFKKFDDSYYGAGISKDTLEKGTEQEAHIAEAMIGYSGVPAYLRGSIPAPFMVTLAYKKQLKSRNMPISDLAEFDFHLFF